MTLNPIKKLFKFVIQKFINKLKSSILKMENNSFEEIWDKLKEFKKAIITLHSGPDGDSLGSCTAMKYVLEKYLNYEVTLISYDKLSEALNSLEISKGVEFEKDILDVDLSDFDVLISLDTGNLCRLGKSKKEISLPKDLFVINIDHHKSNEGYGNLNYVSSESSSTCSILVDLFQKVGLDFDSELSKRLLLGICTDTGFFKTVRAISNVKKTFEQSLFLINHGADYVDDILMPIGINLPWKMKKYRALLITNAKINKEKRYCYSLLSSEEINDLGLNLSEVREGVQELQDIKDIDLIWTLAEVDNYIKGSFRCKSDVDVSKIAEELGGGGHKRAAAFILEGISLEEAEKKVINTVEKFI